MKITKKEIEKLNKFQAKNCLMSSTHSLDCSNCKQYYFDVYFLCLLSRNRLSLFTKEIL